eukprot:SM000004S15012  [mRNA]  locus=s4:695467:697867:- [translate_table: standard]
MLSAPQRLLGRERPQAQRAPHLLAAHTRLALLGGYVVELAFAELLLQRYPRETPAALRERTSALINKRALPTVLLRASLDRLVFPDSPFIERVPRDEREPACKGVFLAVLGAAYLTSGMREVYRLLFDVFALDLDSVEAQPQTSHRPVDEDFVVPELDGDPVAWRQVADYVAPEGSIFAHPRLFRACVPPGMHRFRGNSWEREALPKVFDCLRYPLVFPGEDPRVSLARDVELSLALQLSFLHPSLYKADHPRFCFERLEYLGQRIQDLVMAERLLMKHLDRSGVWIYERHNKLLRNRACGRYLREKALDKLIDLSAEFKVVYERNRVVRALAAAASQQALHAVGYLVYSKKEVKRLLFSVWQLDGGW